jgi:hypothetical protein
MQLISVQGLQFVDNVERVYSTAIAIGMSLSPAAFSIHEFLFYWERRTSQIRRTTDSGAVKGLGVLMCAQVVVATALLTATLGLGRSLLPMLAAELGFDPNNVYLVDLAGDLPFADRQSRFNYMTSALEQLETIEGVRAAAGIDVSPLSGALPGRSIFPNRDLPRSERGAVWQVTEGYFDAMGIQVIEGRGFLSLAESASGAECVLSQSAVGRIGKGEDVVGSSVVILGVEYRVVGIVGEVTTAYGSKPDWGVYVPFEGDAFRRMTVVVRTAPNSDNVIRQFPKAFQFGAQRIAIRARSAEDYLAASVRNLRVYSRYFASHVLIVSLLTIGGVYALIVSYLSSRHRRHLILLSLGARPLHLLRELIRHFGLALCLGLLAGSGLGQVLQTIVAGGVPGLIRIPWSGSLAVAGILASVVGALCGAIAWRLHGSDLSEVVRLT